MMGLSPYLLYMYLLAKMSRYVEWELALGAFGTCLYFVYFEAVPFACDDVPYVW